ncbi:MAG: thioredoxin family protein [Oscillatoriales cyanobacterium RU_3_3]|nr:thioredoxin family protein [Microcoleus sp. SU_5_6]NJL66332.1 thioredoxin family protein [Microcoleus sp. SM1_3_4]NJM63633.1 thioredoxin family protein [Oscillatoriales cyanobacterium RU_3_3]NJR26273.1 thioredoxin family protein [Richelia sp. CSU_2_1]
MQASFTLRQQISMAVNKVEVIGSNRRENYRLTANFRAAIARLKIKAQVRQVTDPIEIAKWGTIPTPAAIVNGEVLSTAKVIDSKQIEKLLLRFPKLLIA